MCNNYNTIEQQGQVPIKAWTKGVPFEDAAIAQLNNIAQMSLVHSHIAVMPDVHMGKGATIGSVIPSVDAVIPAAVGVDIGCGMVATKTTLTASQLPDNLAAIRHAFEAAVPHGRTGRGRGARDRGAWHNIPDVVAGEWQKLEKRFEKICAKHPAIKNSNHVNHLGTMGTGNHFLELCLDENNAVWIMLHSGSRGVGNRIGTYFIELAKKEMERHQINLPDMDLAYLKEGSEYFDDYVEAVEWAQDFAAKNREIMMFNAIKALKKQIPIAFETAELAVNCHHNYISREHHFGKDCFVTRKGAVRAQKGEMGIIPGSMGARSFIVRGLGNPDSFNSCSHGAGRVMSRTKAKKVFNIQDQIAATQGVECRKDAAVIDEIPHAYKDIEKVMAAQQDLVEVVHTLKQIVCVKG
ncbi:MULTISPECIES: RtcB family protein [Pseudoalteromonas]|jgi:tRNA-splicing ligase RtcB|uniref:RtcB family protein n=1 Tax=Pseudoalteromonas TaxID=53246 RepID=UPI0007337DDA|nr:MULTISPECIES: RtcB family protein [Pseudoalteromonas]KTG18846.1 RNA-splicing ligase RtcB [Pseudoalteromonas sp. XI10]MBC7010681.1 RtcB family protein [Pseudoalteromonas sp. BZK2]MCZ4252244.1 RtcB family protein [Pseudoalteromonas shioyasakiensis]TMO30084.1 RtcB family protein [Pseudoalteromonas sp. S4492]|tara:strand:- start:5551 stop:6777 length:1227 start_codon:yes stop_codon:yes gene_type:complete